VPFFEKDPLNSFLHPLFLPVKMAVMGLSLEEVGFLAAALAFNTFTAPAVKITQSSDGSYAYNKYSIYFVAELIKLLVAGGMTAYSYHTDVDIRPKLKVTKRDAWQ
jgi:hypothetical protein